MLGNSSTNERQIGRVMAVSNYRITVILDPEIRSQVRAYSHRTAIVTQIGGYLTFPVAPGEFAVGIIVGASEDEMIEPDFENEMTLQLTKSRRILKVNLLGKLLEDANEQKRFVTGVSLYPTLETAALFPTEPELKSILEYIPRKEQEDTSISIGISPIYARQEVTVSYNDILGRPLGVIGNTGSGKSYSIASLIQAAQGIAKQSKFIILDINGEYFNVFCNETKSSRELNTVYVNNKPFVLPLWIFNLSETTAFFEASQASQVPILERVITSVREDTVDPGPLKSLRKIVRTIDQCLDWLGGLSVYTQEVTGKAVGENTSEVLSDLKEYTQALIALAKSITGITISIPQPIETIDTYIKAVMDKGLKSVPDYRKMRQSSNYEDFNRLKPGTISEINKLIEDLEPLYQTMKHDIITTGSLRQVTADSPIKYDLKNLERDALFRIAIARFRGQERIQEYIATLRLRIHRQLSDKRWSVFTKESAVDFSTLIKQMIGSNDCNVVVIDCSMLAYDVLPFFCAVFGRTILELRSHTLAEKRTDQPFVIILEEAHNYIKQRKEDESFGLRLSRETFERIAKEGRKFGLSLAIASQRPSDVSATVLSQCANFIVHRIQNPEDIDFFKKILPTASRDLLDQLPILAPGDGLLLGSSVNVPARVRVTKPKVEPSSKTPKPWQTWKDGQPYFDTEKAMELWAQETIPKKSEEKNDDKPKN